MHNEWMNEWVDGWVLACGLLYYEDTLHLMVSVVRRTVLATLYLCSTHPLAGLLVCCTQLCCSLVYWLGTEALTYQDTHTNSEPILTRTHHPCAATLTLEHGLCCFPPNAMPYNVTASSFQLPARVKRNFSQPLPCLDAQP